MAKSNRVELYGNRGRAELAGNRQRTALYGNRQRVELAGSGPIPNLLPPSYAQLLVQTHGASEVWPLIDIESGTTIFAEADSARNGTLTGWLLQNAAGIVPGTLAPRSDGINDVGDIFSASVAAIDDPDEGSCFMWGKVAAWNASVHVLFASLRVPFAYSPLIFINSADELEFRRYNGTTLKIVTYNPSGDMDWFSVGASWSVSNDEFKAFFNGAQVGATQTGIGAMPGAQTLDKLIIAARDIPVFQSWNGWMSHFAERFGSIWTPADFLAMHNDAATAPS